MVDRYGQSTLNSFTRDYEYARPMALVDSLRGERVRSIGDHVTNPEDLEIYLSFNDEFAWNVAIEIPN